MKRALMTAAGILFSLAGLWVGCYVMGTLPSNHWAMFPTYLTALAAFVGGIATSFYGLAYTKTSL